MIAARRADERAAVRGQTQGSAAFDQMDEASFRRKSDDMPCTWNCKNTPGSKASDFDVVSAVWQMICPAFGYRQEVFSVAIDYK